MMNMKDSLLGWPATFFRHIGPSDSKIHMLMSDVDLVNKSSVEGFVKCKENVYKLSKSIFCGAARGFLLRPETESPRLAPP